MKYNLADKTELENAWEYLNKLTSQDAKVNITKVHPGRSIRQNSYLHVLLGIAGMEWGYTLAEMKTLWKRDIAQSIFVYEKNGKKFIRSSAELDSKELTRGIDQLMQYCSKQGLYLPEPDDEDKLMHYENLIEQNNYL